jgi:hypothetical protein
MDRWYPSDEYPVITTNNESIYENMSLLRDLHVKVSYITP